MLNINAFLSGLIFGLGLILSGMSDPAKVIGFLDVAGSWDPTLMFVMGGAVSVGAVGFTIAKKRRRSWLDAPMPATVVGKPDKRLILGSLIFGIGWGIAGFCPGPALVDAAAGQPAALWFVASMLAGMVLFNVFEQRKNR